MNIKRHWIGTLIGIIALACIVSPSAATQSGTLNGKLSSSDGSSVEGIRVSAIYADDGKGRVSGTTETDAQGRYVIGKLPPGRYYILAGLSESPIYYPGVTSNISARAVTVGEGTNEKGLDFVVHRVGVTVSGKLVMRPTEKSVSVTLSGNGSTREVSTGNFLSFEFRRVLPGTYKISTSPDLGLETSVTVKFEDIGNIELKPAGLKLFGVSGRIVQVFPDHQASPAPSEVILYGSLPAVPIPAAKIQPDGSFLFPSVAPGKYKAITNPGPMSPEIEIEVKDSAVTKLEVPIYPRIPLNIHAAMDDGSALPIFPNRQLIRMEVFQESKMGFFTAVAADGTQKGFLTPGKDYVFLSPPDGYFLTSMSAGNVDMFKSPLIVSPESAPITIEARIGRSRLISQPSVSVKGRLTGGQSGIPVMLTSGGKPLSAQPDYVTMTSRDGTFEFSAVGPGRYNLAVNPGPPVISGIIAVGSDVAGLEIRVPSGNMVNGMLMGLASPTVPGFPEHLAVRFEDGTDAHTVDLLPAPNYAFVYALPAGRYRVSVQGLPPGYFVKTMTAGNVDLLSSPMIIQDTSRAPLIQFLLDYRTP